MGSILGVCAKPEIERNDKIAPNWNNFMDEFRFKWNNPGEVLRKLRPNYNYKLLIASILFEFVFVCYGIQLSLWNWPQHMKRLNVWSSIGIVFFYIFD